MERKLLREANCMDYLPAVQDIRYHLWAIGEWWLRVASLARHEGPILASYTEMQEGG